MAQIHEFLLDFQLFKKIKNPSGTIVPKELKYFFSVKLCVFSVKHCVIKTLKNLLRSAFPERISKIRVPIFFGFLSSIHHPLKKPFGSCRTQRVEEIIKDYTFINIF